MDEGTDARAILENKLLPLRRGNGLQWELGLPLTQWRPFPFYDPLTFCNSLPWLMISKPSPMLITRAPNASSANFMRNAQNPLHMGVGTGGRGALPPWILRFWARKGCFLSFEQEISNLTTSGPPWKNWVKIPWWPPLGKILPTLMPLHQIDCGFFYIQTNSVVNMRCPTFEAPFLMSKIFTTPSLAWLAAVSGPPACDTGDVFSNFSNCWLLFASHIHVRTLFLFAETFRSFVSQLY